MARKGSNIYKRKDGRWEGRFKSAVTGKYRSVYGKTYSETRERLINLQKQTVAPTRKCGLTVKELFDLWLGHIRYKVKASSYANYLMKLELHIYPAFGDVKFEALTPKHLYDFIETKLTRGRVGGGGASPASGLSEKYVADMLTLLKSAAKFAEREHNFNNPIRSVAAPKARQKELHIPKKHEQEILRNTLSQNFTERNLGILFSLFTGIRLGELCALKWSDIDFSERTVRINKTVQRVKRFDGKNKTELIITSPKSEKSKRMIPLPDFLLNLLPEHRKAPECYILSGTDKLTEPRVMQYYFKTVLKKAKLPSINFHMMRHIFATNCLACGFDVKTLSEILGHATVELTLNRYVHSSDERKRECMDKLRLIS